MSKPDPNYIPKLSHNKVTGRAVVRLSGVDVYCGLYGTPEAQERYDREIAEWLARGRTPKRTSGKVTPEKDGPGASVNDVLLAFWKYAEGHYRGPDGKPTSHLSTCRQTIRAVRRLYGLEPAAKFGPLSLKAVQRALAESDLARAEVNRRVTLVRKMFKWAAGEELIPFDVYHRLTAVAGLQKGKTDARETEPVLPVDEAHVLATLPHLNRQVAGMVRFIRLTGCRPGEACRLRTCDVDRSGAVWLYRPHYHKNTHRGKGRVVPIGPKAQALLSEFPNDDPRAYVFDPRAAVAARNAARSANRRTPRYPSHVERNAKKRKAEPKRAAGARYTTQALDRAVARGIAVANRALVRTGVEVEQHVTDWAPNQLRHAFATEVRRRERGLEAAQVLLGHSRADVTQVYAERDLALAVSVAGEIG